MLVRHGAGGAGDVVRRTRQLDRGGAADAGRESKADEHGKGVVDNSAPEAAPWNASLMRRRSPASRWPMLPSSVEKRISPDAENRVTVSKSLGSKTTSSIDRASSRIRSGEASPLEVVGPEDEGEGAVGDDLRPVRPLAVSAVERARRLIQNEPATPTTSSPMRAT